jgi:hypothetical protein
VAGVGLFDQPVQRAGLVPQRRRLAGAVGEGRYALALALLGLLIYAIESLRHADLRLWRTLSVPLAIGCLLVALVALNGYGALGAIVTAIAAVAWLLNAGRLFHSG